MAAQSVPDFDSDSEESEDDLFVPPPKPAAKPATKPATKPAASKKSFDSDDEDSEQD